MPLPDDWDPEQDPLVFARAVLGRLDRSWICAAEVLEVPVVTPLVPSGEGLVAILGAIAHDTTDRGKTLVHRIVCVVAEVASAEHPRHESRIQWPAAVVIDGERYPRETET